MQVVQEDTGDTILDDIRQWWYPGRNSTNWKDAKYTSNAVTWLTKGAGLGAILAMPLGPAGFVIGGVVAGGIAVGVGLLVDWIRFRNRCREADLEQEKIDNILRWADFVFYQCQEPITVLLYVIINFHDIVLSTGESATAEALGSRLRLFLSRWDVQEVAAQCIISFFTHWRDATPDQISTCAILCRVWNHYVLSKSPQTCARAFAQERRPPMIYQRMQELLAMPSVARLFEEHAGTVSRVAQEYISVQMPSSGRPKDWIIFADLKGKTVDQLFRKDFTERFGFKEQPLRQVESSSDDLWQTTVQTAPPITTVEEESAAAPSETLPPMQLHPPGAVLRRTSLNEMRMLRNLGSAPYPFISDIQEMGSTESMKTLRQMSSSIKDTVVESISSVESPVSPELTLDESTSLVIEVDKHGKKYFFTGGMISEASKPIVLAASLTTPSTDDDYSSVVTEDESIFIESPPEPTISPVETAVVAESPRPQSPRTAVVRLPSAKAEEEVKIFTSLKDLQNFVPELKHRIPIGLYEFGFLDELERSGTKQGWDLVTNRADLRIYKHIASVRGSDLVMVKGYAFMKDIPVQWVLWNIRETPRRLQWDKTFDGFVLVEADVKGNEIVYNRIPAPWPVTNRDFLQWRRVLLLPNTEADLVLDARVIEHIEQVLKSQPYDFLRVGIINGQKGLAQLLPGDKKILRLLPLAFQEHEIAAANVVEGKEFPKLSALELRLWEICPAVNQEVEDLSGMESGEFEPWVETYGSSALFNSRVPQKNRKGPGIVVVMAIPRPRALERILQHVGSFDLAGLVLFAGDRAELAYYSSPKMKYDGIQKSLHLGLEQSGSTIMPRVAVTGSWKTAQPLVKDFFQSDEKNVLALVAHPYKVGDDLTPITLLESSVGAHDGPVVVVIGPERGFTDEEVEQAIASFDKVELVTLGHRILKCEVAFISVLAQIQMLLAPSKLRSEGNDAFPPLKSRKISISISTRGGK